jgi:hypothetical protein
MSQLQAESRRQEMGGITKYHLKLGEEAKVERGWFFMKPDYGVAYAGMPAREVYSLAITRTHGHNSMGYNLYFPADQKTIKVGSGTVNVLEVTPEYILFNYSS